MLEWWLTLLVGLTEPYNVARLAGNFQGLALIGYRNWHFFFNLFKFLLLLFFAPCDYWLWPLSILSFFGFRCAPSFALTFFEFEMKPKFPITSYNYYLFSLMSDFVSHISPYTWQSEPVNESWWLFNESNQLVEQTTPWVDSKSRYTTFLHRSMENILRISLIWGINNQII